MILETQSLSYAGMINGSKEADHSSVGLWREHHSTMMTILRSLAKALVVPKSGVDHIFLASSEGQMPCCRACPVGAVRISVFSLMREESPFATMRD